jgi:hypothetical protein
MQPIDHTSQRNQRSTENLKEYPSPRQLPRYRIRLFLRQHLVLQVASRHAVCSRQGLVHGSVGQGIEPEIQLQDIDSPLSQQTKLPTFCVLGHQRVHCGLI